MLSINNKPNRKPAVFLGYFMMIVAVNLPLKRARILYQFVQTKGYLRFEGLCTRTRLPPTKQFYLFPQF